VARSLGVDNRRTRAAPPRQSVRAGQELGKALVDFCHAVRQLAAAVIAPKVQGWWLITPVGNFELRGRGGADTKAHALEMLDLLEGRDPLP